MLQYTIRRLLLAVITFFGITIVVFTVTRIAPGDPTKVLTMHMLDQAAARQVEERYRARWGLDKPIPVQYALWLGQMVQLDFGQALSTDQRPVIDKIAERVWPTMSLALLSLTLALGLAIPIGIWSAAKQNSLFDTSVSSFLYALYSVPPYVLGMLLILLVGVKWDLLPFLGMHSDDAQNLPPVARFFDSLQHYILITCSMTFGHWAYYSRFIRQNMLEVLRQDYIRTARAKGLSETKIILKHAFRNTLIPVVTLLGLLLPEVISGSVILEKMFNWPGLGRLYFESMTSRDYNTIMAMTVLTALLVQLGILLSDLAYAFVDPRISYE